MANTSPILRASHRDTALAPVIGRRLPGARH